jgi:defect-in-organelle-trafficking protein DotB
MGHAMSDAVPVFSSGDDVGLYDIEGGRLNRDNFDDMMRWCAEKKISDVSIQSGEYVWGDVGGKLYRLTKKKISHPEVSDVVRNIYGDNGPGMVNSGDDLDFAYEFKVKEERLRFRVNITCGRSLGGRGFQITARTLPGQPLDIGLLDVEPAILENFRPPQGLNLITGPTGSGKSTLLSSLIRWHCEKPESSEKILEYSRPVEYVYDGLDFPRSFVHQVGVGDHLRPRSDDTEAESVWAYSVRNALRRAPDIIIIGEARDKATIQGCVEAALTGHLVMSTMHTIGVPETIRRAVMPFSVAERHSIAIDLLESLNLVVTQLLLPKLGGGRVACREYVVFDAKVRAALVGQEPDSWPSKLREIMSQGWASSVTMAQSSEKLLTSGHISNETYEWISSRTSRESRLARAAMGRSSLAL